MQITLEKMIEELKTVSTKELIARTEKINRDERRAKVMMIAHLAEIQKRGAHLELGYSSLFEYCVRALGISEGSVWHRTQVARVCERFPKVMEQLAAGRISLTVAGMISPHLSSENIDSLLEKCAGQPKRQVEQILAAMKPKPAFSPSLRRLPRKPMFGEGPTSAGQLSKKNPLQDQEPVQQVQSFASSQVQSAAQDLFNVRFAAGRQVREKLVRLGEILGVGEPAAHLEQIIDTALEDALNRRDPKRREARRQRRRSARRGAAGKKSDDAGSQVRQADRASTATPVKESAVSGRSKKPGRSRYIGSETRDLVLKRAGYHCEFTAADGRRCHQGHGLEIDHRQAFSMGGGNGADNLQVLCRAHHRRKSELEFGPCRRAL